MVIEKSQEFHLSTCIQLRMTKHPSRKVMNFRDLLGCDTIVAFYEVKCTTVQWADEHIRKDVGRLNSSTHLNS